LFSTVDDRWDEKSGLQRDALSSQVIDALEAQEIKEAGYEEEYPYRGGSDTQQEMLIGIGLGFRVRIGTETLMSSSARGTQCTTA
jgi:hypothetical protein